MNTIGQLIRYAQRQLNIKCDGVIGAQTHRAVERKCKTISAIGKHWTIIRKVVGLVQHMARINGIDAGKIDGYAGEQTRFALSELLYLEKNNCLRPIWRTDEEDNKGLIHPAAKKWPKYNQIETVFGKPGTQLVTINAPYPLELAWNPKTTVTRITCHRKVASSLQGIFEAVRDHYGQSNLKPLGLNQFGGTYNLRKMRGGNLFSTHSWGAAIDLDPDNNRLKWNRDKASFAKDEYSFLREAFRVEGWTSLGEVKDYDWMHFQAVRL